MGHTAEAIAHFVHGAVTAYFLTWTVFIWKLRKQSNMMFLLFVCMAYISFCQLKEVFVLFSSIEDNFYLQGLSFAINIAGVPLVASFFAEVVSPGFVTKRKVLLQFAAQALFIPLFAIFPSRTTLNIALWCAYAGIAVSLILGIVFLMRHRKYIRDNYSYTEHVDVNWALNFAIVLAVCAIAFVAVATQQTWVSRAVFNLVIMLAWVYLNTLARRHSVVDIPPMVMFAFPIIKKNTESPQVNDAPETSSETYAVLAEQLENCMAERKLYLNPKLTLQEVCSTIGTNRTYLSDYLNKVLKTTFYEYINGLRIARACEIIDAMTPENKQSMLEVSEVSGFNSISTFNRSFAKVMGQTPSQYAAKKK